MERARRSFPVVVTAHRTASSSRPRIAPTSQMDDYLISLPSIIKNCEKHASTLKTWAHSLQTVVKTSEDLAVSGGSVQLSFGVMHDPREGRLVSATLLRPRGPHYDPCVRPTGGACG